MLKTMTDCYTCCNCNENEERVKSYERRLALLTQEKNLAYKMLQDSVQRIEQLQEELVCNEDMRKFTEFKEHIKAMHVQMQHDYSDAIGLLEDKLATVNSDLEIQAKKVTDRESEIMDLKRKLDHLQTSQESFIDLQTKEQSLRERCLTLEAKCLEYETVIQRLKPNEILDEENDRLLRQLEMVEKQRDEIQNVLEQTHLTAEKLVAQENEARNKVSEAIALVESSFVEKQQLQHQLIMTQNECKRLQKELIALIEEAGDKVKCEVEIVKRSCQDELRNAESQLELLEKDRLKKMCQIDKYQSDISKLEQELCELKRTTVSHRKIQAVNEQLRTTEMQMFQLQSQNQSLNQVIVHNQQKYENELSKCSAERRFLEKQIAKLQMKLVETGQNLEKAVDQCNQLSDQLNRLNSELANERCVNEYGNTELVNQLQITKNQSNSAMQELKKIVNAHSSITTKWKDEYSSLTKKFNDKMKELKIENKMEKRRNKKLLKKLTSHGAAGRECNYHVESCGGARMCVNECYGSDNENISREVELCNVSL